jgi:hypothetical protein
VTHKDEYNALRDTTEVRSKDKEKEFQS